MLPVTVSIKTPDTVWWGPSVQTYPLAKIATVFVSRRTFALPLVNPPGESNVTYFSTHLLPNGQDGSVKFPDFTDREGAVA